MNLQVFVASLAGSGIEFLETAVIAYALARNGSVIEATVGTVLGSLLVAVPAYFAWPWLARVLIHLFQCMVGILLIWLGGKVVGQVPSSKAAQATAGMGPPSATGFFQPAASPVK